MMPFKQLRQNLKKDFSTHRKVKIALLANSASQFLGQSIQGYGYECGIQCDLYEADYNQIEQQILNTSSTYYQFEPEFTIIFFSTPSVLKKFYNTPNAKRKNFATDFVAHCKELFQQIEAQTQSKIICYNLPEINDNIFGNYANKTQNSFLYQIRKINLLLMDLSQELPSVHILDLQSLQSYYGNNFTLDTSMYVNSDMIFSIDFLPIVAQNTLAIIQAALGKINKCLILDLDNTLWGGIIGDDGIEKIQIGNLGIGKAFSELQLWAKELKQRGIILAVCSKNDEKNAMEPFEKHPEMILRLNDIAIFVANWNNKADNIHFIQETLNIGFDAMVFLDDNPFERNMVRTHLPQVTVPELPEDPAQYLNYLRSLNLFETLTYTENDNQRTQQYQAEAKRKIIEKNFTNENEFLASLEMQALVEPFTKFNTPRVAQLTQRSNQFNLRTIRYSDNEIQNITHSDNYITFAFSLSDKFGDHGLISVILLEKYNKSSLFVDTWVMSCRVLKRGMEDFALCKLVEKVQQLGYEKLIGEYIPTSKNGLVKDHYQTLDFTQVGDLWELNISSFQRKPHYIKEVQLTT